MTALIRWALPGAVVVAASVTAHMRLDAPMVAAFTDGYALVSSGLALLMAVLFHRSRAAVAAAGIGGLTWLALVGVPAAAFVWATALLTAAVGGLALFRDRGVRAPAGAAQGVVVGVLAAGGWWAWTRYPEWVTELVSRPAPPWFPLPPSLLASVPTLLLVSAGVASTFTLAGALQWRGPVEGALFWCVLLLLAAGAAGPGAPGALYLAAGSLLLTAAVVETSYALAYRDDLTGLPARRALNRDLEALPAVWAAAMVDVDHFKRFNDRHGHDVGDQVLRLVASTLARSGGGGKAYRYGGEEFTILFPGKSREEARPLAEAVRRDVAAASFRLRGRRRPKKATPAREKRGSGKATKKPPGRRLSVTVSIGLADSAGAPDAQAVLKKADRALYRAKKAGRNRVAG